MFRTARQVLTGTARSRGFTLVELLIVILIVGILAAVAVPLYLGYTQDARSAEGKALAGSALTALQGCVQARGAGGTCDRAQITNRVGIGSADGVTGDLRWQVSTAALTVSTTSPPTFSGTIEVIGKGTDTANIGIGMYVTSTGVTMRCTTTAAVGPGATGGDPC